MNNKGALPVYLQISEMLIREIAAGHIQDGERLAPERKMAKDLNISVGTLRKSLADLATKGMLKRRHGSGNYVHAQGASDSIYAFFRLELLEGGGLPTAKVLDVTKCEKPDSLPVFSGSTEGYRIRRVRSLNDVPVAIEEIWLDAGVAEMITAADLSHSLYLYYKKQLDIWIARAEDKISIGKFPSWSPAESQLVSGAASGFIERTSWTAENTSVEYSRTWFDTNVACYVSRLK